MSNRPLLLVGVVAGLAALGAVAFFATRSHGDKATPVAGARVPAPGSAAGSGAGAPSFQAPPTLPSEPGTPGTGAAGAAPALPGGTGTDTYAVGDVMVRDHRSGPHDPMTVQPAIHPPTEQKIASTVTSAIGEAMRPKAMSCLKDLTSAERGAHPKVDAYVAIAIKDGTATVIDAKPVLRDITGGRANELRDCVAKQLMGTSAPATGEADRAHYDRTMSYLVR